MRPKEVRGERSGGGVRMELDQFVSSSGDY